jgi:hypothetical protein
VTQGQARLIDGAELQVIDGDLDDIASAKEDSVAAKDSVAKK